MLGSNKNNKDRVDNLLVIGGLADSTKHALALVMSGVVMIGDRKIIKASEIVSTDSVFRIKGIDNPWVSRGGLKLDYAVKFWNIDFSNKIVLDVGASTGGFSDVALFHGAKKVYAVDVGIGQIAWKLRTDSRVIVMDKTNACSLDANKISEEVDILVCDASFIRLSRVLENPLKLTKNNAELIALIKPQFEASRNQVENGGIVRDSSVHDSVIGSVTSWVDSQEYWRTFGVTPSPIKGMYGNVEFLLYAKKTI